MHAESHLIIPVAPLPPIREYSFPEVMQVFDRMRSELSSDDSFSEFWFFAHEYPLVVQHH